MEMLALTDAALARLCIGATRVSRGRRQRWLKDIAERIDPPPHHRAIVRARQARHRARQRNGIRVFKLEANYDLILCGLIDSRRISERDALDQHAVERVLSEMLTEWGQHWREARKIP
jgi:hypothetical protein